MDSVPSIEPYIVDPPYDNGRSIEAPESGLSPQDSPEDRFPDYCGLDVNRFVLCLNHPFCPEYPDSPQTVIVTHYSGF